MQTLATTTSATIYVATGVIFHPHDNTILIALRPPHAPFPGLWEFPGGKIETGESARAALCRELAEEVGIEVINATPWMSIKHHYPTRCVYLEVWQVYAFSGDAYGCEGQTVRWVSPETLPQYEFPAANEIVIRELLSRC